MYSKKKRPFPRETFLAHKSFKKKGKIHEKAEPRVSLAKKKDTPKASAFKRSFRFYSILFSFTFPFFSFLLFSFLLIFTLCLIHFSPLKPFSFSFISFLCPFFHRYRLAYFPLPDNPHISFPPPFICSIMKPKSAIYQIL